MAAPSRPRSGPTRSSHGAYDALADLLGVDGDELTLGPNMTTLTFHLSRSIAAAMRPGDEIVVSGLDHQANVDPWIAAARDNELIVRTWEPELDDCTLRLEDLDAVLNDRTRLVAVGWASNAVGTINPIAEIAKQRPRRGRLALRRRRPCGAAPRDGRPRRRCRLRRLLGLQVLRPARRRGLRARGDPRPPPDVQGPAGRPPLPDRHRQLRGLRRRGRGGRVPRRPRVALRRARRMARAGASRSSPACTRFAPTSWTSIATSRAARGDRWRAPRTG